MNRRLLISLTALSILASPNAARAAKATVGFLPVEATNLSTGEEDAIGELFAEAYADEIGAPVLSPMDLQPELDAVTSATPPVESNVMAFDCRRENIRPGVYRYCVQTHIVEQDNILFSGMIEIGEGDDENIAEADPGPRRHVQAGPVLTSVKARYHGQRSGK